MSCSPVVFDRYYVASPMSQSDQDVLFDAVSAATAEISELRQQIDCLLRRNQALVKALLSTEVEVPRA
jgi:hypothetical protein